MLCPLCKDIKRENIPEFDTAVSHAFLLLGEDGSVHVHAPFDKPSMIKNFIEKFIIEAEKHGIIYTPRYEGKGQ